MKHIPIRTTSLSILIAVLLLAAVVLLACGPASQSDPGLAPSGPVTAKDDAATSTPKPKEDPKYLNLSPFLQDLAQLYEANELTEEQIAAKAPMYHGPQVFVDIDIFNDLAKHEDLGASLLRGAVDKWLENEGAFPKHLGPEYWPPYIYAWVKVSDLGPLSQQPGVTSVQALEDKDGSFAQMVASGESVLYLPIWVKDDPYERLDRTLAELLYRYKKGELTAEQVGTEYQGRTDSKVFLDIELASDPVNTKATASWLEEEGVVPRSVSKTEQYVNIISAEVPVSLLDTLAGQPLVIRIHSGFGEAPETGEFIPRGDIGLPKSNHTRFNASTPTPTPTPTPVISQGVAAHGATAWQPTYTGTDVKVGIIDLGFQGFPALMDGELPPASQVSARCYGSGNLWTVADTLEYTVNIADCGDNLPIGRRDNHGTLVAQAVVDMAEGLDWFVQELLGGVVKAAVIPARVGIRINLGPNTTLLVRILDSRLRGNDGNMQLTTLPRECRQP